MLTDIVLEVIRASIVLGIFMFVLVVGRGRFKLAHHGWRFIVVGFGLLLFGSVLDITDNFDSLNRFVVIGDTEAQAFLEKFVGYLGGYAFLAIGLLRWIPTVEDLSERKRIEQELRGREAQMRLVTDALPALIAYFDTEQRLQFVNKTFESWYGVPRSEIVGRTIRDVMADYIAEADYERFRPHVATVLTGEDVSFEELVTYPDGKTRYVWVTYVPEFGSDKSIRGAFALIQDITERKRMEEVLNESEARLSAIIDNAPNAISLKDRRGHYLLINRVFEDMLDTTSEEVKGKTSLEIFPAEFAESGLAHDRAVIEQGRAIELEEELVLGDHAYTYLTTKFPIRDASGDIVSIGAIHTDISERKRAEADVRKARDELEVRVEERTSELRAVNAQLLEEITERKQAEATLKESEAKFRELLENSPVGVAVVSHAKDDTRVTGNRLFINNAFVQMFGGGSREDLIEAEISDSWVDLDQLRAVEEIMTSRDELVDFEAKRRRLDGTEWWVSMNSRSIRFDDQDCTMVWHFDITERKRAEVALRESEARLAEVARIAGIGHSIWDERENREVYSSEEGDRIWGARPRELWDFDEFLASVHPDDRARVEAVMERARENLTGYEIDYRIVRPDGEMRFVLERADAVLDDAGEHVETVTTVQDITERKQTEEALRQARDDLELRVEERTADLRTTNRVLMDEIAERKRAEQALQESEDRYREIFEQSPIGIWVDDWSMVKKMIDGLARRGVKDWRGYFRRRPEQLAKAYDLCRPIEISRAILDIYRAPTKQAVIDATVSEKATPEILEGFLAGLIAFIEGKASHAHEATDIANDGSKVVVRNTAVISPEHRDSWSRVLYSIEDITDRDRSDKALRESEQRLSAIINHAPVQIYLKGADGRHIMASQETERLYGRGDSGVVGMTAHDLFPKEYADIHLAHDRAVFESGEASEQEYEIPEADGIHKYLTVKFPIPGADGEITTIGAIATDVTERRQTEDRVRRREAELAQVLRASTLGEMGATLAHEVNQPLTTVISISDVCLRKLRSQTCRPEELERMLEQVCEQGERAAQIIRRIGRFVRRSTPDISPTHVNDMVSEAVELLKSELRSNNVELRLELERGLPAVSVDSIEIEQVLMNLMRNGSDALSEILTGKRELAIQTSIAGEDMVEVSVSDSGPGLADDAVQNAFEPFFTTKPNGMGMGLSISRTIIEAHGGRLWWSDRGDRGTIFSFTLPIDRRAPRHGA